MGLNLLKIKKKYINFNLTNKELFKKRALIELANFEKKILVNVFKLLPVE